MFKMENIHKNKYYIILIHDTHKMYRDIHIFPYLNRKLNLDFTFESWFNLLSQFNAYIETIGDYQEIYLPSKQMAESAVNYLNENYFIILRLLDA